MLISNYWLGYNCIVCSVIRTRNQCEKFNLKIQVCHINFICIMCFIYVYHHIIYVFCIHVWCSAAVSQRFRWIGNLCFFFSLSLDRNYRKAERNFAINTHNNSFSHEICLKQRTHTATQTHIHTHICNMHTQYCVWYMWEYIAIQPSSPKIFQCPLLVLSPSCFPGFSWFIFFFFFG